ncbi:MAG: hypothetical protein V5A62_07005 [Haloarculaceae archaeon]
MRRRTLLGLVGAGALPLAGCTAGPDPAGTGGTDAGTDVPRIDEGRDTGTDLPEDCPASQGLDVDWPEDLDASAVESFVEAYEHAYVREVVVDYEPESRLDSYELSGGVTDGPTPAGEGWVLECSGSGGIYRPTLALGAATAEPPEGADAVPASEVENETLAGLVQEAAETGEAEHHVEPPGEKVDRYVDLLASLSDGFDRLSGRGESDSLYVDVDGTTVELSAMATNFHGDYWWESTYYVDERVVRRTEDEDVDPRDGELLECRRLG